MNNQSYHRTIDSMVSPMETSERINRVWDWWTKNFEGESAKVNDTFTVRFGKTFVSFRVSEMIPGEKITWEVTDSYLDWQADKEEWTGTRILFEISGDNGTAQVTMTHEGLVPGIQCYENCEKGWTFYVGESLAALLSGRQGLPDQKKSDYSQPDLAV